MRLRNGTPFRWYWQQLFAGAVAAVCATKLLLLDRTHKMTVYIASQRISSGPSAKHHKSPSLMWTRAHIHGMDMCSQWFCSNVGTQSPRIRLKEKTRFHCYVYS